MDLLDRNRLRRWNEVRMDKKKRKQILDEILEVRYYEPQRTIRLSNQLVADGKKEKDEVSWVCGEYYRMEAYFRLGRLNEAMLKRAMRVLQASRRNKMYEMECRCYNMLGILLLSQEDFVNAMEYYQSGMNLALKHHYSLLVRIFTNNIGDLYLRMKDYPKALSYLKKVYQQTEKLMRKQEETGKKLLYTVNLNVSVLNISEVYCLLGDYEESLNYIQMMRPEERADENMNYLVSMNAIYALDYGHMGRMEDAKEYIWKVIESAEIGYGKLESMREYLSVCQMLIENNETESAQRLLGAVRGIAEDLALANVWCDYYETLLEYQRRYGTKEELLKTYEHYFFYKKQMDEKLERQQIQAIRNRQALDSAEKKQLRMEEHNRQLKRMSEHDALTGLCNRYVLNKECEKWYQNAKDKETTLGIMILDVDYFKQYNDAYGHLGGDDCLKCVSGVLRETVGANGMVARYGGDEFFVLTRGKTDEEMLKLAKDINERIREKKWGHKKSLVSNYITLSQGITNGVPQDSQMMSDLIHLADNALYRAKEARRGFIGICRSDGNYSIYDNQGTAEEVKKQ